MFALVPGSTTTLGYDANKPFPATPQQIESWNKTVAEFELKGTLDEYIGNQTAPLRTASINSFLVEVSSRALCRKAAVRSVGPWPRQVQLITTIATHTSPALEQAAALGHIQYAYNQNFSCPIPPRENRPQVAIRAGEKWYNIPLEYPGKLLSGTAGGGWLKPPTTDDNKPRAPARWSPS
jgi:hypothetical protein